MISRVTKRFLLHNSRENEDIKESDFDELKMEFQAVKADMLNDMRGAKENLIRYSNVLYDGINLLSEFLFKQNIQNSKPKKREKPTNKEEIESKMTLFRSCAGMFKKDIDDLYNPISNRFNNMGSVSNRTPPNLNEKESTVKPLAKCHLQ